MRVTGIVQERDGLRLLEVEELSAEHNHGMAPHGGVIGMSGNRHIELVTTPDNEIRVYVLDDCVAASTIALTLRSTSSAIAFISVSPKRPSMTVGRTKTTAELSPSL